MVIYASGSMKRKFQNDYVLLLSMTIAASDLSLYMEVVAQIGNVQHSF